MSNRNGVFVSTLTEALSRSGLRHACVTPGSRNTPLSLAFAAHPNITDWSHHDERSAGFFALGLAKTLGEPIAVVTTSGTAAGELLPAILEAHASRVPLIVITADRPTELFDVGAPQTVDQRSIFGSALRWQHDLDVPEPSDAGPGVTAALAVRLVVEATSLPSGPVHLNLRFREPLVIDPDFNDIQVPTSVTGRSQPTDDALDRLAARVAHRRGVIVAGPAREPGASEAVVALGTALGWPIMSDPISGLRAGRHSIGGVVGSDLLAAGGFLEIARPEVAIRVGAPPTSKAVRTWMATSDAEQIVIDPAGWPDPDASATTVVRADTAASAAGLAARAVGCDPGWLADWVHADRGAVAAAHEAIEGRAFPSDPAVVASLARSMPDGAILWTASSMPIRDVDSYFPATTQHLDIMGNRGANGIDGFISTALGSAAAGRPTVAHVGDLSMLHDVGALATAVRLRLPITILVVNNDGGGIFHFLPQNGHEHFERHFGTPHGLSFRAIAEGFGLDAMKVTWPEELDVAIAETATGPRLVEVVTDRTTNVQVHRDIAATVATHLSTRR